MSTHVWSPRTQSRLGDRSFGVAGPRLWNNLPVELRQQDICLTEFRRLLKTVLFRWDSAHCDCFVLMAPGISTLTYLLTYNPHTSVPRLPDRFCTPLQQQWSGKVSAPLGDRHQLLCSMYKDETWRQSFLCGQASRVEQFASGSSSRGQFAVF